MPCCPRCPGLAGDLAGLDAGGAHVEALRGLADHRAHGLDVGVPAPLRAPVRVRDAVTEARPLAADVAVRSHGDNSSSTSAACSVLDGQRGTGWPAAGSGCPGRGEHPGTAAYPTATPLRQRSRPGPELPGS